MAIRIPLYKVNAKRIIEGVKKVSGSSYKKNALNVQAQVRVTDGVKKSVELMNKFAKNEL